jgi:hypothetical protein
MVIIHRAGLLRSLWSPELSGDTKWDSELSGIVVLSSVGLLDPFFKQFNDNDTLGLTLVLPYAMSGPTQPCRPDGCCAPLFYCRYHFK